MNYLTALEKIDILIADHANNPNPDITSDQLLAVIHDLVVETLDKASAQESEKSWASNPDRSGGQFTDSEILESSRW